MKKMSTFQKFLAILPFGKWHAEKWADEKMAYKRLKEQECREHLIRRGVTDPKKIAWGSDYVGQGWADYVYNSRGTWGVMERRYIRRHYLQNGKK